MPKLFPKAILDAQSSVIKGELTLPRTAMYARDYTHWLNHLEGVPGGGESDWLFIKAFCASLRPELVSTSMVFRIAEGYATDEVDLSKLEEALLVVCHSPGYEPEVYLARVIRDKAGFVQEFLEINAHESLVEKVGVDPYALPEGGIPDFLKKKVEELLDDDVVKPLKEKPEPQFERWASLVDEKVMH